MVRGRCGSAVLLQQRAAYCKVKMFPRTCNQQGIQAKQQRRRRELVASRHRVTLVMRVRRHQVSRVVEQMSVFRVRGSKAAWGGPSRERMQAAVRAVVELDCKDHRAGSSNN